MDSSVLASAARDWWADPFLWAVTAALLAGIAAGQELGAVAAPVQGRIKAQRRGQEHGALGIIGGVHLQAHNPGTLFIVRFVFYVILYRILVVRTVPEIVFPDYFERAVAISFPYAHAFPQFATM